ncbi:hypothetical protein JTB14_026481 [Gonioctena quinquepunctata]|nr:hypothetical protein JTB14_026481 [Gonioctena quinquepunctata]
MTLLVAVFAVVLISQSYGDEYVLNNKRFPENFIFGVASSAYQIEGAWNEDGKTPHIWDNVSHVNPGFILDQSNGDIACDSYHKYKEDVAIMKDLGVTHYRFSLSWTRILPSGFPDTVNPAGVAYYRNLIKELKDNGIEPLITIFHWDLPLNLEQMGGFINESIIEWYSDYARVAFDAFGDEVKLWATFNEPRQVCTGGYGYAYNPPAISSQGLLEYVCAHNLLRAHTKAWHIYNDEFRAKQRGKVTMVIDSNGFVPASESAEDQAAAETRMQFEYGWFANPVYYGDYPEIMKTRIARRSQGEGRSQSRLPEFTEEEKVMMKGTIDFFSVNTYTGSLIKHMEDPQISNPPSRWQDMGVQEYQPSEWETSTLDYLKVKTFLFEENIRLFTLYKNYIENKKYFE